MALGLQDPLPSLSQGLTILWALQHLCLLKTPLIASLRTGEETAQTKSPGPPGPQEHGECGSYVQTLGVALGPAHDPCRTGP